MTLLHCLCFVACDVTVIFLLTCDFSDVDSKHDEYVVPYQAGWCYMKSESVGVRKDHGHSAQNSEDKAIHL